MIQQGKRLAAQTSFYANRVDFYLADHDQQGKRMIADKIEFGAADDGVLLAPSFSLPMEAAQEFFEQMWAQGFRSAHDRGGADKLDAARVEHLADLRKAAKLA
jgi:hypothetical protein